ncbi:GNAT family N-acetyltransferase [Listeria grayi]|uniref:Acetyltransferase, GNAT family n=1 Tax=Listeria grayi DSM 20601 TaxID=525367 RepID=D7UWB1_LISGR|nr:GNAT family protein [Listeria grayi]EFI84839.1 acetyltransferase, GNAT family [Listeria grayi DSM 20601]
MHYNFTLSVDEKIDLVQPSLENAKDLYAVLDNDREHLRKFLNYVDDTNELADEENYFRIKLAGYAKGTDRLYLIAYESKIVGAIDLHFIDAANHSAEIGYWINSAYIGKGIAPKCVQKLCQIGFETLALNRITLVADTENKGSNRVAEKCGFMLEGTLKQSKLIRGEFRDFNTYALLKSEFAAIHGPH